MATKCVIPVHTSPSSVSQVEDSEYHLETAMGLYDLTDFELMWERAMDTKCLLAWNPKTHTGVICFRGTASLANVLADLQARIGPQTPALSPALMLSWLSVIGQCLGSHRLSQTVTCFSLHPQVAR
jgi:hypothetical protein